MSARSNSRNSLPSISALDIDVGTGVKADYDKEYIRLSNTFLSRPRTAQSATSTGQSRGTGRTATSRRKPT